MSELKLRIASPADAEAILAIYAHYVSRTAISFECAVPSTDEFRSRIENTLQRYPYIVAERDCAIVGYAYAGPFVGRAAYAWSAEMTVYVAHNARKGGIGKALYAALEECLRRMGILNLYACIACPDADDEYLTRNSIQFHGHMGFSLVGEFRHCGRKFDRWYNIVWMEKSIGETVADPREIIPFPQLPEFL